MEDKEIIKLLRKELVRVQEINLKYKKMAKKLKDIKILIDEE